MPDPVDAAAVVAGIRRALDELRTRPVTGAEMERAEEDGLTVDELRSRIRGGMVRNMLMWEAKAAEQARAEPVREGA